MLALPAFHPKLVYFGGMIIIHVILARVESRSFSNVALASIVQTESIVGEFESYNAVFEVLIMTLGFVELIEGLFLYTPEFM